MRKSTINRAIAIASQLLELVEPAIREALSWFGVGGVYVLAGGVGVAEDDHHPIKEATGLTDISEGTGVVQRDGPVERACSGTVESVIITYC